MNPVRRIDQGWWMAVAFVTVSASCVSMEIDDPASGDVVKAPNTAETQQGLSVPDMARYCSRTYPTHGWTFHYGVADPCTAGGAGGTIQRAGLYSTTGVNNVVVRCEPNYVWYYSGIGTAPLGWAFDAAAGTPNNGDCIFSVSAAKMPIFGLPYPAGTSVSHGSGLDHDRFPNDDGKQLDFRGQLVSFINDHDAEDIGMPSGTPMYAPADGYVLTAGMFSGVYVNCNQPGQTQPGLPDCGDQAIVIIKHTVTNGAGLYDEYFASGFFHMQAIEPSILAKCTPVDKAAWTGGACSGATVTKGQLIGYSGARGSASAPHLHFATWRLTNTARNFCIGDGAFAAPQPFNFSGSIGPTLVMDSMGWRPSPASDPWATDAYFPQPAKSWPGGGTLSPDLWITDPPINW